MVAELQLSHAGNVVVVDDTLAHDIKALRRLAFKGIFIEVDEAWRPARCHRGCRLGDYPEPEVEALCQRRQAGEMPLGLASRQFVDEVVVERGSE